MDGRLSVQELWEKAVDLYGDGAPTQSEMVNLLSQLHTADVLMCDVSPDAAELFRRGEKIEQAHWKTNLRSPLFLRFPLLDPEAFLARTIKFVRPFFSLYGALLWLAVVASALALVGLHWSELTENVVDRVLSAKNLLTLWLVYPLIKGLHELGHGYAVKKWGGEVHEMGIMLLVLMPIPYVDASSASAFRTKWQRALVGASGMIVELFVAALAMFLWVSLQPGMMRSIAYNLVLIGGVSAVLFNGNPLLRYDGYYILADLIDIPNLAQRSMNYVRFLVNRYLWGIKEAEAPYVGPGERFWLVFYSLSSFVYRLFVYVAIVLFIAGKFFIFGIVFALWASFNMLVLPILKSMRFVMFSPVLRQKRARAVSVSGALILGILGLLFLVPFPSWTRTEGVVWAPEDSLVRAGTNGVVQRVMAAPNALVKKGEALIECRDFLLNAEVKKFRAQLKEFETRYEAVFADDQVQARILLKEIENIRANLDRAEERLRELTIRSPKDGVFVLPMAADLPERYLRQGDLVGYILDKEKLTVRVVVPQADVDLVRSNVKHVELRFAERLEDSVAGVIKREVPGAMERLPSTILGTSGGGKIPIDPFDSGGLKTFEKLFQFDIELLDKVEKFFVGGRVYVRFDHGFEPLGFQWYRSLRQLFLRRFNV